MDNPETFEKPEGGNQEWTIQKRLKNPKGAIKNGQSRNV